VGETWEGGGEDFGRWEDLIMSKAEKVKDGNCRISFSLNMFFLHGLFMFVDAEHCSAISFLKVFLTSTQTKAMSVVSFLQAQITDASSVWLPGATTVSPCSQET
jgi:hypothetical protein